MEAPKEKDERKELEGNKAGGAEEVGQETEAVDVTDESISVFTHSVIT